MRGEGIRTVRIRGGYQNNEKESEGIRIVSMRVTVNIEVRIKVTKDTDQ
jgi:hypothetical protein